MLVVPLEKDKITTKDRHEYRVVTYTNFKEGGPAVYCRSKGGTEPVLIYFFDIDEINGVRVEYHKGSRVFTALGKINREQHLPQPDDKVMVPDKESSDKSAKKSIEVTGLKLKSKTHGHNRGMLLKDAEGNYHRLKDVTTIDRSLGSDRFNKEAFKETYHDYMGV